MWHLEPILNSYFAVIVLAMVLALLLLVQPTFQMLDSRRRWILMGIRIGVIVLMLLAMLRPTRVSTTSKRQSAVLLLMMDVSRSMQLPNTTGGGKTRWEAMRSALDESRPLIEQLREDLDVKLYGFDSQLRPLEGEGGAAQLPTSPTGEQTDIGSSLYDAVRRELGQRIAAVVLLSDGAQTAFEPRVELHEAGRELARLDYPLYTVPFGPSGEASQFADLAIENLPEQYSVFVKNELLVKAMLRVRGFVNEELPVELKIEGPGGFEKTLGPYPMTAEKDGQQLPVQIRFSPEMPGQYKLTLRAAPQPRERVTKNNELSAYLNVLDGGVKVAYLIGGVFSGPPGEQIRLRQSLASSADIDLQHKFIYDGEQDRRRWPIEMQDFLDGSFDVFMIENVPAAALGKANIDALSKQIDEGKGMIMIGGFHSFGPGAYRDSKFADVLPITMGRYERQDFGVDRPISRDLHLMRPLRMLPSRSHPVIRLAPQEQNDTAWRRLPPLLGANKFAGVKPAAQILAQSEKEEPLLVTGEYGKGRVLAFAGDSTRRWWKEHEQSHKRFWRQAVLWLARSDDVAHTNVWIDLPQRRFNQESRAEFTTGAKTTSGEPVEGAVLKAVLLRPNGQRESLELLPREDDVFAGRLDGLREPGGYKIEVTASAGGKELGKRSAEFQVLDRDIELSNPAADPDQLMRLSSLTKSAGGRTIPPEQLSTLLQELRDQPPKLEIDVQTKWQLASTWWDAWIFFGALVGLLTLEWTLRKKWRLV